jgi:hypothetical protein
VLVTAVSFAVVFLLLVAAVDQRDKTIAALGESTRR